MASIYLTNALTGWYDEEEPPLPLLEFKKEWKRAQKVKQKRPILVIIGNPPYRLRSSAKMDGSEKHLIAPYKDGKELGVTIRNPRAIHDLYVKFFRVAERRINETGKGVMCYISNYSYTSEESFPIMRKHLMASFDKIWIDSMNGSLGRNNMKTPEGKHDPSVFTTPYSTGIATGTAIGLFVKKSKKNDGCEVRFRDFWGEGKRDRLLESLGNVPFDEQYEVTQQDAWNGFRFSKSDENQSYLSWPTINDLPGHTCLTGANEARNEACIHIDRNVVKQRMKIYFDKSVDSDEFKRMNHEMIVERSRYNAIMDRNNALDKEVFKSENLVRMLCGPFDVRWAYHAETGRVWAFKNDKFRIHMKYGDGFLATRRTKRCGTEGFPVFFTRCLGSLHMARGDSWYFPLTSRSPEDSQKPDLISSGVRANLSAGARDWLESIGLENPDTDDSVGNIPWLHALAITWAPAYLKDNATNLEMGWPRIPLPADAETARSSADLGSRVAELLDSEQEVPGVTSGRIAKHLTVIGHVDGNDLTMPHGRPGKDRQWSPSERKALEMGFKSAGIGVERGYELLGPPIDIALNAKTFWRGVPKSVWDCFIGGHQPVKSWISSRKKQKKGVALTPLEVEEVIGIIRRITTLILMTHSLNANYEACFGNVYEWPIKNA